MAHGLQARGADVRKVEAIPVRVARAVAEVEVIMGHEGFRSRWEASSPL